VAAPAGRGDKELRSALARFRMAVELQAGLPEPLPGTWKDHLAQGRILMLLEEPAQARTHLARAGVVWRVEMARLASGVVTGAMGSVGLGKTASLWACAEPDWQGHGPLRAYQAYCWARLANHQEALALGRTLLDQGYRTPALLNNVGFSALRREELAEAMRCFDEALRRAPNLVPALYNRCQVTLRYHGTVRPPMPKWALTDMARAVELVEQHPGHEPTQIYRIAVKIYALGTIDARQAGDVNEEHRRLEKTKEYLGRGCMLGLDPEQMLRDPQLRDALGDWLTPDKIVGRRLRPHLPVVSTYLVDPLAFLAGSASDRYNPFATRPRR
jgi:tetratricopeptide (TPR) repeat protein